VELLSINVAELQTLKTPNKEVQTGIFKQPVAGPVMVRSMNIDGDRQGNLQHHGGAHQAVYVYSIENHEFWTNQLGGPGFKNGQFGENLTVTKMLDTEIMIGDRFSIGDAEFEVTCPRAPCFILATKMQRSDFVREFRAAGRPGFYCKVLREGQICAGDSIHHQPVNCESLSIAEAFKLRYFDQSNLDRIRFCASLPAVAPRWRAGMEKILQA
jgi:MOSC domain-containing protein YiiM